MKQETAELLVRREHTGGYLSLSFAAPGIASAVQPGQFVHLRVPAREDLVLRRPFSVFKAAEGRVELLFKPVGSGTRSMADMPVGTRVDLVGPLGRGFPEAGAGGRYPLLVAGGYGMAALYLCAERAADRGTLFIGGRSAEDILCVGDFEALGWDVRITTEDGSRGAHGRVTDALDTWIATERKEREPELFACGPDGLLRAVAERAVPKGWPAWLSMDRHMGCGVGACLTCVQRIRTPGGETTWARVCRDGPVFEAGTIVWEAAADKEVDSD